MFYNIIMTMRYNKKKRFLDNLKKKTGMDYTGRIDSKDASYNGYEGCYPIKKVLKKLNIQSSDSVLDIGCGKGLFLYYAKEFPFSKISGIEFSQEYFRVAQKNMTAIADARIELICGDALQFEGFDDYNYFFFNNPFGEEMTMRFVQMLWDSFNRKPRGLTVIYQFPVHQDIFLRKGFQEVCKKKPTLVLRIFNDFS